MSTIRERDAEYVEGGGAGYDRHEHPESECPADVDRRALMAAGDALAQMLQMQHPVEAMHGLGDEVIGAWCDGCDANEKECWAAPAIAAWEEVTG